MSPPTTTISPPERTASLAPSRCQPTLGTLNKSPVAAPSPLQKAPVTSQKDSSLQPLPQPKATPKAAVSSSNDPEEICLSSDEEEDQTSAPPSHSTPVSFRVKKEPGASVKGPENLLTQAGLSNFSGLNPNDIQDLLKQFLTPGMGSKMPLDPTVIQALLATLQKEEQSLMQQIEKQTPSPAPTINTLNNYNCQIFTLPNQSPFNVTATTNPDLSNTATLTTLMAHQLEQQQRMMSANPAQMMSSTPARVKQEPKFQQNSPLITPRASTTPQSHRGSSSGNSSFHLAPKLSTSGPYTTTPNAVRVIKKEADNTPATTVACCLCAKSMEAVSVSALADVYTAHLMEHLEAYDDPVCPKCRISYEQKASMVEHFLRTHGQMKKLRCDFCPREFWLRKYLNQHVAEKHEDDCITLD